MPIIPCSYGARSRVVLNTWDRFVIPLPFTRGVILWGEPIHVAREGDSAALDAARLAVEAGVTTVTQDADRLMGVAPVEPAPAALAPEAVAG